MKSYENYGDRIKIKYPANWTYQEYVMGAVVTFVEKESDVSSDFASNVSIIIQDFADQPVTLQQYTKAVLNQIQHLLPGGQILESGPTMLSKKLAHKVVSVIQRGALKIKILQVWTIVGHKGYLITVTTEEKRFQELQKVIHKMLISFKIM